MATSPAVLDIPVTPLVMTFTISLAVHCSQCQQRHLPNILLAVWLSALAALIPRLQIHSGLMSTNIKYSICHRAEQLSLKRPLGLFLFLFIFFLR